MELPKKATSASKQGNDKVEVPKAEPFLLSEGLPPVPAKVVAEIQSREFIDMAELLRDNIEATRRWREAEAPHCSGR